MSKSKTILFDLDGTLTDTMPPQFSKYRDGQDRISINNIPVYPGARELVSQLKSDGHQVFIVSDSHPKFVGPIARDIFEVAALSLAYKPSTEKTQEFIEKHSSLKLENAKSRIFFIGDNKLDILTARKLEIPSIHIIHEACYRPEIWSAAQKAGPTFSCRNFSTLYDIITRPQNHLLVLEGAEFNQTCWGEIQIDEVDYRSSAGRRLYGIALARQETGPCDRFGKANWYCEFSSVKRTPSFLGRLAHSVAQYITFFRKSRDQDFDILSFIPDKKTTRPPEKMETFAHMIKCGLPVQSLMQWKDNVQGSIRNQPHRLNRFRFVSDYMEMKPGISVAGKNIVLVDDQLTTGATMDAAAELLRKKGANHILFIALFRMIDEVDTGKTCIKCGKEMSKRRRKSDGNPFYSCVPEKFGGVGCGHTENISNK